MVIIVIIVGTIVFKIEIEKVVLKTWYLSCHWNLGNFATHIRKSNAFSFESSTGEQLQVKFKFSLQYSQCNVMQIMETK